MLSKSHLSKLQPSSTLLINEQCKAIEKSGGEVFKFGFGQSPFPIPQNIVDELKAHAFEKDYLPVNGLAKKAGFQQGDIISEFKIENTNRPDKDWVYPLALILLGLFGFSNYKRDKN